MKYLLTLLILCTIPGSSALAAEKKPLQVFILAGQSNMQGHAKISTMEHIGMDPATQPMLQAMLGPDGKPKVCGKVWITSIGGSEPEQTGRLTVGFGATPEKIGPEFTFGIYMEQSTDAPILIIKTAWGGKSLNTDFRPPSAGPYQFSAAQSAALEKQGQDPAAVQSGRAAQTGVYYRKMLEHVKLVLGDIKRVIPEYDAAQGYELAGFAWFQGWNDLVDSSTYPERGVAGGYDAYSTVLAHFIRDVRRELNAPKLPFVIGVLGVGGPVAQYGPDQKRYQATHQNFRDAMAAPALLPEFHSNVAAVLTEKYWDQELTAAKAKETGLKQRAKKLAAEQKLNPAAEKALAEKMRGEELTPRERKVIDKGISNLEFHYLGSAKILGGVGRGLAEAMAELIASRAAP